MANVYDIKPGSYATKAEVADAEGGQPSGDYVTQAELAETLASYPTETEMNTALAGKQDAGNYATVTQLADKKDKASLYTTGGADAETELNPIALKDFVNSSIGTNTANYISDNGQPFASVSALEAYSGTVTNNDYAFVTGVDSDGNTYYDRYKATVNGETVTWAKEYRLNNSSFTQAQWNAISSGITSGKVATYDGYATTIAGKQDALTFDNAPTADSANPVKSGGVYTAISGIRAVPASTSADEDKVLTVDANGDIGWETPSGGGGTPANMVTTDTDQTINADKSFGITDYAYQSKSLKFIFQKYGLDKNWSIMAKFNEPYNNMSLQFQCSGALRAEISDKTPVSGYQFKDQLGTTILTKDWLLNAIPESDITGDGVTTAFTVAHSFGKMPAIVQVTKATGEVMKDTEVSIVKSTTNVVVTFTTAPASGDVYKVAMLY